MLGIKRKEGESLKKRQAAKENMRGLKQLAEISKETLYSAYNKFKEIIESQ